MTCPTIPTPSTPLRDRMIEDMKLHRLCRTTQRNYLRDVERFAIWLGLQSLRYRGGGRKFLDLCCLRIDPVIEHSNLLEHRDTLLAHQSRQIAAGRLQDYADAADVLDALRDNVPELIQSCPQDVHRLGPLAHKALA